METLIVIAVVAIIGIAVYFNMKKSDDSSSNTPTANTPPANPTQNS
jgi:hypothetical protein